MTSEDEGRGDQPMDWTHGGCDEGRGYSGKKVHQNSLLKCWTKGDFVRKTVHYLYFKQ